MGALSTPVSSLRAAAGGLLSSHPRDPHPLKPHHILSSPKRAKPKFLPSSSLSHHPLSRPKPLLPVSPSPSPSRSPPPIPKPSVVAVATVHQRASTGYAAALLDAARCDGALPAVARDVRRFARFFRAILSDPSIVLKGEVLRAAAECGGFDRRVVALVRMLVGKRAVEMVGEVMAEFGRICDELSGNQTVLVSSERRMEEAELAGIAREVQRVSGAATVKVRHLFRQSSVGFAV